MQVRAEHLIHNLEIVFQNGLSAELSLSLRNFFLSLFPGSDCCPPIFHVRLADCPPLGFIEIEKLLRIYTIVPAAAVLPDLVNGRFLKTTAFPFIERVIIYIYIFFIIGVNN